jgi:hypothetical protein
VSTDQFKMRRVPPPEPVQSASSSQGAVAPVVGGSKIR